MGRRKDPNSTISHTLPSSPTHSFSSSFIMGDPQSLLVESFSSSSSSDFEFTISLSPRKSSAEHLCPADELFYKGQLLPLHLSPRISMVRTLLASSSTSTSTSASSSSASRDSTGSSNDSRSSFSSDLLLLPECDSSRPSSVTDQDDQYKRLHTSTSKKARYFTLSRFSSVFRKEATNRTPDPETEPGSSGPVPSSSVKRMSATAKEVIRKYLKKVKPLYEKLSQNQRQINPKKTVTASSHKINLCMKADNTMITHSFSGNLRYPRRRNIVSSCPSSIKSSPTHSGVLSKNKNAGCNNFQDSSSMDELQSAIQGAIAYCKNSLMQEK